MSDFLFAARRRAPGELRAVLGRHLGPVSAEIFERHGEWGSLAVARAPHDGETLVEADGALTVLAGIPVARVAPHAPGLAAGGLRRRAVHELLARGPAQPWDERLDSGFAALRVDTARGGGMVVTDIASFVPVFFGDDGGLVIGTHPDAVARAAGRHRDVDPVSAADLLLHLSCTYPHTLFRGVQQFPPATARRFGGGWLDDAHTYWRPTEENPYATRAEAAAALREGLRQNLREACGELATVGILLSGGEDARAVLGAMPPGPGVRAFVYADWENREVRVARAAARAYGVELTFGARRPDHYLRGMEAVAGLLGSGQLFMDVHGYGFHEELGLRDLPLVLGGLSSDSFLKGEHAPPDPARGSVPPFPLPDAPELRPELRAAVAERRTTFRRWLAEIRPATAEEWERLYPFTQRKHSANFHGNRRLFASHEPYHSVALVKVAAAAPLRWKNGRVLFHEAVRPLLAPSWYVPHARWRFPYFGRAANLPLTVGLRVARGVRALATGELRARQGPWPKWRTVVQAPMMAQKRRAYPVLQSRLAGIFTASREDEVERAVAQWPPLRQLILLQLAYLARAADE